MDETVEETESHSAPDSNPTPAHPYTNTGEPNVGIGADGNSYLPGDAARERHRRGPAKRFKGFPKKKTVGGQRYDLSRIKKEFFDSPVSEWYAYCATKGYNPAVQGVPWKTWVREKKYLVAWNGVRDEIESTGASVGPRSLLNALKAAKNVPEVAGAMLALTNHCIQIHLREAAHDQQNPTQRRTLSASVMDVSMLSSAMKASAEVLYKSLGIDTSLGLDPNRWMRMVEENLGRVEGLQEALEESKQKPTGTNFEIEVIGSTDAEAAVKFATETYLDKLRVIPSAPTPGPPPTEGTQANVANDSGEQ